MKVFEIRLRDNSWSSKTPEIVVVAEEIFEKTHVLQSRKEENTLSEIHEKTLIIKNLTELTFRGNPYQSQFQEAYAILNGAIGKDVMIKYTTAIEVDLTTQRWHIEVQELNVWVGLSDLGKELTPFLIRFTGWDKKSRPKTVVEYGSIVLAETPKDAVDILLKAFPDIMIKPEKVQPLECDGWLVLWKQEQHDKPILVSIEGIHQNVGCGIDQRESVYFREEGCLDDNPETHGV